MNKPNFVNIQRLIESVGGDDAEVLAPLLIASQDKTPVCVHFKGDRAVAINALLDYGGLDPESKRAVQKVAREEGAKVQADGVAFMMEAWQSARSVDEPDDGLGPSERADRRSVVIVEYQNLDSSPLLMTCPCDGSEYDPAEIMRQFDEPVVYEVVQRIADQGWL